MDRSKILKKVHEETDKSDLKQLVPKLVYGVDRLGNYFIYFKMKDFSSDSYEDDSFVLMYQNPKNIEETTVKRQFDIIEWFKKEYDTGKERSFGESDGGDGSLKKHFFIKGMVFKTRKKINKFYLNSVRRMISTLENKFLIKDIVDFQDNRFLEEPGLFNYVHSKTNDNSK